jgi:alpha-ketoglutarate-dependent taurine dioxygenase
MATKRKTRQTEPAHESALAPELKAAQAHWQELKRRARAAKAAAKDAKKAVKRLRKLLLAAKAKAAARKQTTLAKRSPSAHQHGTTSTAKKPLRIAGTPEPRVRPKRRTASLRKSQSERPTTEVQSAATAEDTTAHVTTESNGPDDGTQ